MLALSVAQDGEEHAERERADPHRDGSPARRRPSLRGDQLAGTAGVEAPDLPGVAGPVQDQGALAGRAASAIQLLVEAKRDPSDSRRTGTSDPSLPDLQPAEVAQPAVVMTAGQQGSGDADRSDRSARQRASALTPRRPVSPIADSQCSASMACSAEMSSSSRPRVSGM